MSDEKSSERVVLFRYYVEQARHTENLWVQISKFFTTLITGLVAAIAFMVKPGSASIDLIPLITTLFALGGIISFFAFGVVLSYQMLIREWVTKKQLMEEAIWRDGNEELRKLCEEKILPISKPKSYIMPLSAGVFLLFGLLFIAAISISLSSPELIRGLLGEQT